jgi:hypothetical protein
MKIKQIILLCFLIFSLPAIGQQFNKELSLGVSSGVTGSNVSFMPTIKQNYIWSYNGGITVRFISEKHFGLQGEINYSPRGWKENTENDSTYLRKLNYIELPLLTHLYFGKKFRFIVNLGPKVAYLMSEKTSSNFIPDNKKEYKNIAHKFDYGLCGGGGFEFRAGSFNYIIEGRYNFSLADLFSNGRQDDFMRSAHRNITINVVVLYNMPK